MCTSVNRRCGGRPVLYTAERVVRGGEYPFFGHESFVRDCSGVVDSAFKRSTLRTCGCVSRGASCSISVV